MISGRIHSFQSLGTVDGPGVRFVVFFQGCNLRCKCCHNPDSWNCNGGELYSADEVVAKALRFKGYFGDKGGITLSGGEPLLQSDFAAEIFRLCKKEGINTCLDTSGSILNDSVKELLSVCDRVLLDIKYTDSESYRQNVGCELEAVIEFLDYLNAKKIPVTVRQVIIPTVNDSRENILKLKEIVSARPVVDKIELLPFRKICQVKYDNMSIPFPFGSLPEPDAKMMAELNEIIK